MTCLRELPRRIGKRGAGGGSAPRARAELACKEKCPEERQHEREDEEQVVDDERSVWPLRAEQAGGRVAEEHVREREVVFDRPVEVRLQNVQGRVQ